MIYDEYLKMTKGGYQFEKETGVSESQNLEDIIGEFFSIRQQGVHVALICTDSTNAVINSNELCEKLKEKAEGDRIVEIIGEEENVNGETNCYCIAERVGDFKEILSTICEYAKNVLSVDKLEVEEIVASMKRYWDDLPVEKLWKKENAEDFSKIIPEHLTTVPDIRIILIFSEERFDYFLSEGAFFPKIIEYVVRGIDESQKKIAELEKENQKYKEHERLEKEISDKIIEIWSQCEGKSYLINDKDQNSKYVANISDRNKLEKLKENFTYLLQICSGRSRRDLVKKLQLHGLAEKTENDIEGDSIGTFISDKVNTLHYTPEGLKQGESKARDEKSVDDSRKFKANLRDENEGR